MHARAHTHLLAGAVKELAHAGGATAHKHFHEVGARAEEEGHLSLGGDDTCKQRLACFAAASVAAPACAHPRGKACCGGMRHTDRREEIADSTEQLARVPCWRALPRARATKAQRAHVARQPARRAARHSWARTGPRRTAQQHSCRNSRPHLPLPCRQLSFLCFVCAWSARRSRQAGSKGERVVERESKSASRGIRRRRR